MMKKQKLILLQDELDEESIVILTKSLIKSNEFEKIILVLNKDYEAIEETLIDNFMDEVNSNEIDIMRDYYYEEFKNNSSILTGMENIEDETFTILIPSKSPEETDINLNFTSVDSNDLINFEKSLLDATLIQLN